MNQLEAIKQLKQLKVCCEEFETIETCDEDVKALEIALEALREYKEKQAYEEIRDKYRGKIKYILLLICLYMFYLSLKI